MKLYISILFLLSFHVCLHGQQKLEGAIVGGATYFLGDLNEDKVVYSLIRPNYGIALRYNINPHLIIKGQAITGMIAGDDKYTPNEPLRGAYFNNRYYSSSLSFEYLPLRNNRSVNYRFNPSWSPYATFGLEYLRSVDHAKCRHCGDQLPETLKDSFISSIFGVGARIDPDPHFSFGTEFVWHAVFSDFLDGISKLGNPNNNDWIIGANLYVSYFFGEIKPQY